MLKYNPYGFESFNKVTPYLYIGDITSIGDIIEKKEPITHILSLTKLSDDDKKLIQDNNIIHIECLFPDLPTENVVEQYKKHSKTIMHIYKSGGVLLIHCKAGRSRSVSFGILSLMEGFNKPYEPVYKYVDLKRINCINPGFVEQMKRFRTYF